MIPVFRPCMDEHEIKAVAEVIRSGWIGLGPKTAEFEVAFAEYVGSDHAVAVNSATAALHLSCLALGIGPGDEVLVPTITFVSTAHAVRYCGATPVFVDVMSDTLNIDVVHAESRITGQTRAVIPVHYGGHSCGMDDVWAMARKYRLAVIEDAAHACGAEYQGEKIGGLSSDTTCFSFHAVKNLTTADGGMVTTNQPDVADILRRLRWCGITKDTWQRTNGTIPKHQYSWYYEVQELGYKCHMNDIMAAIGLVQLAKLDEMNARRREIADTYDAAFSHLSWLRTPPPTLHNYVIKTRHRNELNLHLHEQGISTGVHYMPIHLQPYYQQQFQPYLPVAERVWLELLTLPLYPDMADEDVHTVTSAVIKFGAEKGLNDASD